MPKMTTLGNATEDERCSIAENAVKREGRVKLGSKLAEIGRELGGVELEINRDRTPAEPTTFS